jgi:hypothetical protein
MRPSPRQISSAQVTPCRVLAGFLDVNAETQLDGASCGQLVRADTSGGGFYVHLPDPTDPALPVVYSVLICRLGPDVVKIDSAGGALINGVGAVVLDADFTTAWFTRTTGNAAWVMIGCCGTVTM